MSRWWHLRRVCILTCLANLFPCKKWDGRTKRVSTIVSPSPSNPANTIHVICALPKQLSVPAAQFLAVSGHVIHANITMSGPSKHRWELNVQVLRSLLPPQAGRTSFAMTLSCPKRFTQCMPFYTQETI